VFVDCEGVADICAAIRTEIVAALQRGALPVVRDPQRAEIALTATVRVVSEVGSLEFGTPLVTTTYAVTVVADAGGFEIPMPAPRTFGFDARFGAARLPEHARVIALEAVSAVQEFRERAGR
jgi:hypothetical protein